MKPTHIRIIDGFPCITLMEHEHIVGELSRKEWVGLTGEERHGLYRRVGLSKYHQPDSEVQYEYDRCLDDYARAIEAKLKEKNCG